jgi:hypothetical protein
LPVKLGDLKLSRSGNLIELWWETQEESSSKGFEILKKTGEGDFQLIAFVPSKAPGGFSTIPMNYQYTDVNFFKGICQYRIKMVDLNGTFVWSGIRSIRAGDDRKTLSVFPNPSKGGYVNFVFSDGTGSFDLALFDMKGSIIQKWEGVNGNLVHTGALVAGIYLLKIQNRETHEMFIEKIIVE